MEERQNDADEGVILAITTFPNSEVSRQIGTQLVESQLAACVNLIPGVESIYSWKGKVERDQEVLCLIKTTRDRWDSLAAWVREHHPYEEPELIVIPVEAGLEGYLEWVRRAVS